MSRQQDYKLPELLGALKDCADIAEAAAQQLTDDDYIEPKELQAIAEQLADYAMKARAAINKAEGRE